VIKRSQSSKSMPRPVISVHPPVYSFRPNDLRSCNMAFKLTFNPTSLACRASVDHSLIRQTTPNGSFGRAEAVSSLRVARHLPGEMIWSRTNPV